jgi:tRNA (adenine-N(1)-)-methyltransferase non-catalytic subunit
MELKRQGIDGREIIARQIAEHEAFALKNVFSKAKYQKRKESKFLKYFTVLPPTIHNICKYWNDLEAKKIRDLRSDTLAEMLTLANIRPGSRVIVVDDTSGLLVGAVAERMAGEYFVALMKAGDILILHQYQNLNRPRINFSTTPK